ELRSSRSPMPSRPDLREIATNVREAFADADRETLLDVLTFVLKEYVVEGPPPMLVHQAENLADLKGATFAQLISAMQTRFDHPELAMFVVDGEQVSVRVGGVVQPLLPSRQPLTPATELPRPAAGVRVVETTLQQRLHDATDAHAHLLAVDDEHRELGMIEPRLHRGDELRERRALEVRQVLGLMDQHRRRPFDDVLLDDEREHVEQGLAIGVGERVSDVRGDVAKVGTGRHRAPRT
ncbi:MAG TPA: hypothetical protein VM513_12615, partial [Kofleriaceae bacterium]|nr:hypothetical protein [Kofleriaceae bacterium]